MKTLELILDESGKGKERRRDTDNTLLRQAKIKMLAYKGEFDKYCSAFEVADAKKGYCPHQFEVHHIIPLVCSNTSFTLNNMVIIEKKAHSWLHKNIIDPALARCKVGQSCSVFIPDFDTEKIMTVAEMMPFIHSFEANKRRIARNINER